MNRPVLLLVALAALALLAALLTGPRWDELDAAPPRAAPASPAATEPLAPAAASGGDRSNLAPEGAAQPAEVAPDDGEPPEYAGPYLALAGKIVEGRTGEPVPGAELAFDAPEDYVKVTSDEQGRFELALRADAWEIGRSYRLTVTQEQNQRLFLGNVILEEEMLIHARSRLVLRGRLLNNIDDEYPIGVQAHVPPAGTVHVAVYAGKGVLDLESRFEFPVWCDRIPGRFQLSFGSVQEFGHLLTTEVLTSELISEEGATLEWYAGKLTVSVVDEEGDPLNGAQVDIRVEGFDGRQGGPAPHSFLVPPGRVRIAARREGHAFARDELEMGSGLQTVEHRMTLRRLSPEDRITGRVVDPRGNAVEEAAVSARPDTGWPDLDSLHYVVERSAADGSFALVTPTDVAVQVEAFHKVWGFAPAVRLEPGATEATLRFEPKGSVRIHLTDVPSDSGAHAGMVQWLMVREATGAVVSSHDWSQPFLVDDLFEGAYVVSAYLMKEGLYAQRTIEVVGEKTTDHELPMQSGAVVRGTLRRTDGSPVSGLNVVVLETDLPDFARETWSKSTTSIDGRFFLLLGPSGRGRAAILDMQKNELARMDVAVDRTDYLLP